MAKFHQYRTFITVVEAGSISKAALSLHCSSPAISKQLATLESHLKAQLFNRSHKRIQLTDAGQNFYRKCKAILASVEQAEDSLRAEQGDISGEISLTLSKSLCRSNIFDLLTAFTDQHPGIRFNLRFSDDNENLHDSNIDFAFRLGQLQDNSHLISIPLLDTRLVACATPGYIEKHGTPEHFNDLGTGSFMLSSSLNMSEALRSFLTREKVYLSQQPNHQSDDIEAVYHAVRSGMSIGFMLDISVQQELETGQFISLLENRKLPAKRLYLLYKKTDWHSQKALLFKEFIKENMQEIH